MIGHMKTNKLCPNRSFSNAVVELPDEPLELKQKDRDVKVGGLGKHGRDELAKEENDTSPASVLKVEGLMLSIPADFVLESPKATEEELDNVASLEAALVAQKEKLQPLTSSKASKRKKNVSASSASAKKSQRTVQRRFSPIIEFQRYLETVWQKMRDVPDSWPFHYKVDARFVSDYYAIIKQPMDLSKIQENINKQEYFTREAFMKDIDLMVNNCILYNGPRHPLTDIAENLRCTCKSYFSQHDDELLRLEKLIEISFLQNAFNDKT
ncbi:transcription initiation factor TFIID subunit 1-like [Zophobas morio]|uniref:transcription initiation factor TFIID subunit 1-like n=1 Tax=Zophobas morio TaxID=2755281 RepID=UPI0030839B2C